MSRWADAFASLLAETPETPDDTCPPAEPKPPEVSQGVSGVTHIVGGERGATPANARQVPRADPAAIAAHAAELLAAMQANPAVRIFDPDKAARYFYARAAAELTRTGDPAVILRLRSPSWGDPEDGPCAGDRCRLWYRPPS